MIKTVLKTLLRPLTRFLFRLRIEGPLASLAQAPGEPASVPSDVPPEGSKTLPLSSTLNSLPQAVSNKTVASVSRYDFTAYYSPLEITGAPFTIPVPQR